MQSISFTEARARLADTLRQAETSSEPLLISRRGRTAGVLMSWSQYRALDDASSGFGARLARWRAECLAADTEAAADDDPFAGVRQTTPGRPVDWTA